MIEIIIIALLAVFFLFVLFKLFFFVFTVAANLLLLFLAGYRIKNDFISNKYTYTLCAFIALFLSFIIGISFIWKVTVFAVLTAVIASVVIYLSEKVT